MKGKEIEEVQRLYYEYTFAFETKSPKKQPVHKPIRRFAVQPNAIFINQKQNKMTAQAAKYTQQLEKALSCLATIREELYEETMH